MVNFDTIQPGNSAAWDPTTITVAGAVFCVTSIILMVAYKKLFPTPDSTVSPDTSRSSRTAMSITSLPPPSSSSSSSSSTPVVTTDEKSLKIGTLKRDIRASVEDIAASEARNIELTKVIDTIRNEAADRRSKLSWGNKLLAFINSKRPAVQDVLNRERFVAAGEAISLLSTETYGKLIPYIERLHLEQDDPSVLLFCQVGLQKALTNAQEAIRDFRSARLAQDQAVKAGAQSDVIASAAKTSSQYETTAHTEIEKLNKLIAAINSTSLPPLSSSSPLSLSSSSSSSSSRASSIEYLRLDLGGLPGERATPPTIDPETAAVERVKDSMQSVRNNLRDPVTQIFFDTVSNAASHKGVSVPVLIRDKVSDYLNTKFPITSSR